MFCYLNENNRKEPIHKNKDTVFFYNMYFVTLAMQTEELCICDRILEERAVPIPAHSLCLLTMAFILCELGLCCVLSTL